MEVRKPARSEEPGPDVRFSPNAMNTPRLDDPDRLAALRATELLDGSPGLAFERIARLARQLLGVPVALVSVLDDHRQVVLGHAGLDAPAGYRVELSLDESLCRRVIEAGVAVTISNLNALPELGGPRPSGPTG